MLSFKCKFYAKITEDFIKQISTSLPELKVLDLHCRRSNTSDNDLVSISNFQKLEVLKITNFEHVTGSALRNLCKLKELHCENCKNLEDDGLISLLKCANNLESLSIINCPKVTRNVIDVAKKFAKNRTVKVNLEKNKQC